MIFQNERDLQIELKISDPSNWGNHETSFVKREVPIGECIPDIIYIGYQKYPKNFDLPNFWNSKHSFIVSLLRKSEFLTTAQIAEACFEDIELVKPILFELEKKKIVFQEFTGYYSLSAEVAHLDAEVIAIEAKMRNWKEALLQGLRYKQFADKVIVAMDAQGIPRKAEILQKFSDNNIGLCAISPHEVEWLVKPERNAPPDVFDREYLVDSTLIPNRQMLWDKR